MGQGQGNRQGQAHMGPVLTRARRVTQEAARDREMLGWIARFRVVSSSELSVRFGVSEQRVNARVRRLLEAGLLGELHSRVSARRLVYLSRRGARRIGLPLRRAPQPQLDVDRQLVLAMLVANIETHPGAPRVLTEREARGTETETARRLSVTVGMRLRWPDLVIVGPGRLRAVELAFAAKPKKRQRDIIDAYLCSSVFDDVVWIVALPWTHKQIDGLLHGATNARALRYRDDDVPALARALTATTVKPSPLPHPPEAFTDDEWGPDGPNWDALLGPTRSGSAPTLGVEAGPSHTAAQS